MKIKKKNMMYYKKNKQKNKIKKKIKKKEGKIT